jgi:hypothetical protein
MTWVIEQPLYLIILGMVAVAGFGYGWLQTGYRALLYLTIGSAVCVGGLLLLERFVETDVEKVETTLHQIADDLENENLQGVLDAIHPDARGTVSRAAAEFPQYTFDVVDIKSNLKVKINNDTVPPEAFATFNVKVIGSGGGYAHINARVFAEVTLKKVGEKWLAFDYQYYEPTRGMKQPGALGPGM